MDIFLVNQLFEILPNAIGSIRIFSHLKQIFPGKNYTNQGGTTILSLQPLCNRITTSGQDPHELSRWSFVTITGRDDSIVTIISAYRICETSITNAVHITNAMQKLQFQEERDQDQEDIRKK